MANTHLKIAIIQSGQRSYEIERALDFWPGKLSKILSGIIEPTDSEKAMLAQALGKQVVELFPEQHHSERVPDHNINSLSAKEIGNG